MLFLLLGIVAGQSVSSPAQYTFTPNPSPTGYLSGIDCSTNITTSNAPGVVPADECHDYTFLSARGTGEPQFQAVSTVNIFPAVLAAIPGGVYAELQYLANFQNTSALSGINNLTNYIIQKQAFCPDETLVLFGYSQGAVVVHGALSAPEIDPSGIAAVLLQGDPLYNLGQPYSAGTANTTRYPDGATNTPFGLGRGMPCPYVYKTLNICNFGDNVCSASGDFTGHVWG